MHKINERYKPTQIDAGISIKFDIMSYYDVFLQKASDAFFANFPIEKNHLKNNISADAQMKNILDSCWKEYFLKFLKKDFNSSHEFGCSYDLGSDSSLECRINGLEDQLKDLSKNLSILLNDKSSFSTVVNKDKIKLNEIKYSQNNNVNSHNINNSKSTVNKMKYSDIVKHNNVTNVNFLNNSKPNSNMSIRYKKRICSNKERNLILSKLPSLVRLVKLEDDNKRKFGLITNELIQNFKTIQDVLKIKNIENVFYRPNGFYMTLSEIVDEKIHSSDQNSNIVLNNKIFLLDDLVFTESFNNNNLVTVPKCVLKFLYNTFSEFREIIYIKETKLR